MSTARKHILVAEDNEAMGRLLEFHLMRAGFEATVVHNGARAAQLAQGEAFDLVVTDYQMPGGDGEELCRSLRTDSKNCDVPIVLCSGRGLEFDLTHLKVKYRLAAAFCKPISPTKIVAFARSVLEPEAAND